MEHLNIFALLYGITIFNIITSLAFLPHSQIVLFNYTSVWCWFLKLQLPTGRLGLEDTRGYIDSLMQNPYGALHHTIDVALYNI